MMLWWAFAVVAVMALIVFFLGRYARGKPPASTKEPTKPNAYSATERRPFYKRTLKDLTLIALLIAGGYWWWRVSFDNRADGWGADEFIDVVKEYLEPVTSTRACQLGGTIKSISVPTVERIVNFDGSGFDATRTAQPTWVAVNGVEHLYYAGVPFSNRQDLGLAISKDTGNTWNKVSENPLIPQANKPYWATQRLVPVRALHEGGVYRLWFTGNNTNLFTDADNIRAFGYAESMDGRLWTVTKKPIRSKAGANEGARLLDIVKLGNKYLAYYSNDTNGHPSVIYLAQSSDGKTFMAPDKQIVFGDRYEMTASGTRAGVNSCFLGIWRHRATGAYVATTSTNGQDFEVVSNLSFPAGFVPEELVIEGNDVTFFGGFSVGNVNWSYGNASIATARVPFFTE